MIAPVRAFDDAVTRRDFPAAAAALAALHAVSPDAAGRLLAVALTSAFEAGLRSQHLPERTFR